MAIIEVKTIFGPLLAREGDLITHHIQTYGAHTRTDLAFLLSAINVGDDVFDLGAHIGSFTIPLAKQTGPYGRVLAVEGNPRSYELLLRNVALSDLTAICTLSNAIVAPGPTRFRLIENNSNSGASYFEPVSLDDPTTTRGRPLSFFFRYYFVPRLIKLDIEGFEYGVLNATPLAEIGNPMLFAEVSSKHSARANTDPADLEHLLRRQGYRFFWNRKKSHADNDVFTVIEIQSFNEVLKGKSQFNILAVHQRDNRLPALLDQWNRYQWSRHCLKTAN